LYGMFCRCYALGLHNVNLQCYLFDTLVRPLLCYGCEVWGVDWVSDLCRSGNFACGRAEEEVHKPFLRQSLGVCKSTPTATMYMELGQYPVTMFWLRMAAQLWNRALARPGNDWLRVVLDQNVCMARDTSLPASQRRQLWSHHFITCMEELGIAWQSPMGVKLHIDCKVLVQAMMARWRSFEGREVQRGAGATLLKMSCTYWNALYTVMRTLCWALYLPHGLTVLSKGFSTRLKGMIGLNWLIFCCVVDGSRLMLWS